MLALLLVVVFGNRLFLTGDEQRYLLYAVSFVRHGTLTMSLAEWNQVTLRAAHARATSLPVGAGGVVVMNGVYLPVILSPVAGLFSLMGVRAATLVAGIAGLAVLHRLLRLVAGPMASLAALFIVAFSMPLLPYLHLFYMETFLFALVCWAWQRLQTTGRAASGDVLTAAILIAIPIVHMRGSVVAALLFAGLLVQILGRRLWLRAGLLLAIAAATGIGFAGLNLAIYGAVTGPVNTARPPMPWDWFPVLSMQLFNVRHGLFAYAPIWTVGYAGLVCGALRLDGTGQDPSRVLRQALVLGVVAAVTGVGVNPGECWPARFWVLSTPMLAVGLAYWLHRMRGVFPTLCLVGLLGVTAANTMLFVKRPNDFLENRQSSTTYTALFDRFGHVEANLVLPVETGSAADADAARDLALTAGAMILLLAISLRVRLAAAPALLLLLAVLDLARAHRLPASGYAADVRPGRLSLVLNRPARHPAIEIGQQWQTWFVPPALERFTVRSDGPGDAATVVGPANQTILSGCQGLTRTIQVEARGIDLQAQAGRRLVLLESTSLLRRLFRPGPCREAGEVDRDQDRHPEP